LYVAAQEVAKSLIKKQSTCSLVHCFTLQKNQTTQNNQNNMLFGVASKGEISFEAVGGISPRCSVLWH